MTERLSDTAYVRAQYAGVERLATRAAVWAPVPGTAEPITDLIGRIVSSAPRAIIEIGCGTGALAARIVDALPSVHYLATDQSAAMVEAPRRQGLTVARASAERLPVASDSADIVIAAWMLYHVGDVDAALAEVCRVLRPGGRLFAMTNGDDHLADLLRDAGGERIITQFSRENGQRILRRHFPEVRQRDFESLATFPDHAAATAYLRSFDPQLAQGLPHFTGERRYAGCPTLFVGRLDESPEAR